MGDFAFGVQTHGPSVVERVEEPAIKLGEQDEYGHPTSCTHISDRLSS